MIIYNKVPVNIFVLSILSGVYKKPVKNMVTANRQKQSKSSMIKRKKIILYF